MWDQHLAFGYWTPHVSLNTLSINPALPPRRRTGRETRKFKASAPSPGSHRPRSHCHVVPTRNAPLPGPTGQYPLSNPRRVHNTRPPNSSNLKRHKSNPQKKKTRGEFQNFANPGAADGRRSRQTVLISGGGGGGKGEEEEEEEGWRWTSSR